MPLSEGTKLGRYEIRAHIGTGGMGQVYLAQDTSELARTVAIKLLPADVAAALELLEATRRYEAAAAFSSQTLRSMVYLKLGQAALAAAEARKILDHRGQGPLSSLWPLAHLALARASAMQGDTAQARKSYQDFFAIWKDADPGQSHHARGEA